MSDYIIGFIYCNLSCFLIFIWLLKITWVLGPCSRISEYDIYIYKKKKTMSMHLSKQPACVRKGRNRAKSRVDAQEHTARAGQLGAAGRRGRCGAVLLRWPSDGCRGPRGRAAESRGVVFILNQQLYHGYRFRTLWFNSSPLLWVR